MSSSHRSLASRCANGGEIRELILTLQALLPERKRKHLKRKVPKSEDILKEICSYIKKLHKEVDDMSETLSQLLFSLDHNRNIVDADVLATLLQH